MTTIAMTREMGSLGRDVALGLSKRLGTELVHHELVEANVASRLNLSESQVHKFLEGGATWFDTWTTDKRRWGHMTQEAILELAVRGNVILRGWGAAHLLRDYPHVFRVRVCAPMSFREAVVADRTGSNDSDAIRREIAVNDQAHANVIRQFFGGDWRRSEHYDLVLNTERLSVEECIEQVVSALSQDRCRESSASKQRIADRLLELRVQQRLTDELFDGSPTPAINVSVTAGHVALRGWIVPRSLRKQIDQKTRTTPGVVTVSNKLEEPQDPYELRYKNWQL